MNDLFSNQPHGEQITQIAKIKLEMGDFVRKERRIQKEKLFESMMTGDDPPRLTIEDPYEICSECRNTKRVLPLVNRLVKQTAPVRIYDPVQRAKALDSRTNIPYRRYMSCKQRAKKKKFDFEFNLDDFKDLGVCTYCGGEATGYDRIDSDLGYTFDNTAPACGTCNTMKMRMSREKFITHVRKILEYCG
ncbi:MAG: hypothetical protein V3R76_00210 [Gammaproteobacteria bacterium]